MSTITTRLRVTTDDNMVAVGRVRVEDNIGNELVEQPQLSLVGGLIWSLMFVGVFNNMFNLTTTVVLDQQRFNIAIARAAVNNDGCAGVALHPTVWYQWGSG